MMLRSWLGLIFGPNGDKAVQKMQEWAQQKLDAAFDQAHSISFLQQQLPLDDDEWEFHGNCVEQGKKQGKATVIWHKNGAKHVLNGFFHDDHLVGNIHIKHFDQDGIVQGQELLFCKQGVLHGYHLSWSVGMNEFGLYVNGSPHGAHWSAFLGGSYLFTPNVSSQIIQENGAAFIYPDLETSLLGRFSIPDKTLIEATEATVIDAKVNDFGILTLTLQKSENLFKDESEIHLESICQRPTLSDPYESKWVTVKTSEIPEAGQGLFAKKAIRKGQLLAFFHGIPKEESSDYSIRCHNSMIDIPENCRHLENYCATLAHKICHSFEPNADYAYAFHPRFGKRSIRCAVAIKDIDKGQEITCNYKYKLDKAPQWYTNQLRHHLKSTMKLTDQVIEEALLRC